VVTPGLGPLGDGRWREYVGGYSDWLRQRPSPQPSTQTSPAPAPSPAKAGEGRGEGLRNSAVKLSYKEARELEQLPLRIEALEAEQRALAAAMSGPDYHKRSGEQMREDGTRVTAIEQSLEATFERWAELDAKQTAFDRN